MFNFLNNTLNDKELEKVSELFTNLINDYNKTKYNGNDTNDLIDDGLDEISKILSDRFNISIKIKNSNIGTIFISPLISQSAIDLKNRLKDALDKQVIKKDLNKRISNFLYTLDKFENDLRSGIKIDNESFRFLNNNDYKFTISMNFELLISKGLNGREITAVVLHELGHIYDSIVSLPVTVANAADITYTILGYLQETKDPKITILKAYKDKLGEKVNTDSISTEIVFNLYKKYTIDNNKYFSGYSNNFRKENISDMFSVKFGYGPDIASALVKLEGILENENTFYRLGTLLGYGLIIGILLSEFTVELVLLLVTSFIIIFSTMILILAGVIAFLVWLFSITLGTGQLIKEDKTHEDIKTRIQRIKNKIIALASKVNNKAEARELIKEVKSLNGVLADIRDNLNVKLDKIFMSNSEYDVITTVDSLINNELYIQALRLKYLKGD